MANSTSSTANPSPDQSCHRCTNTWLCDTHVYEKIKDCACQIFEDGRAIASGFYHEGYVYTAAHNVSFNNTATIRIFGDKILLKEEPTRDNPLYQMALDITRLYYPDFPPTEPSHFDGQNIREGKKVYSIGFSPTRITPLFHDGMISSVRKINGIIKSFTIQGTFVKGFSGAPVFMQTLTDDGPIVVPIGILTSQVTALLEGNQNTHDALTGVIAESRLDQSNPSLYGKTTKRDQDNDKAMRTLSSATLNNMAVGIGEATNIALYDVIYGSRELPWTEKIWYDLKLEQKRLFPVGGRYHGGKHSKASQGKGRKDAIPRNSIFDPDLTSPIPDAVTDEQRVVSIMSYVENKALKCCTNQKIPDGSDLLLYCKHRVIGTLNKTGKKARWLRYYNQSTDPHCSPYSEGQVQANKKLRTGTISIEGRDIRISLDPPKKATDFEPQFTPTIAGINHVIANDTTPTQPVAYIFFTNRVNEYTDNHIGYVKGRWTNYAKFDQNQSNPLQPVSITEFKFAQDRKKPCFEFSLATMTCQQIE